uniref:MAGUK p55 scaffold protein 4 n=1 Tax=Propithecus coquereli TaxID=379532 RepID=A0A2K6G9H3_PROCO
MIQSDKGADPPDKDMKLSTATNPENGLSQILRLVLQELSLFYSRDVNGVCLLYDLLHSPWLQALLKVYDCLQEFKEKKLVPATPHAQVLSCEVVELLRETPTSPEIQELRQTLQAPHFKGATIKRHEMTGDILVARVIHGGLAERSGLLYAGDKLVEVNGVSVEGLDPEQVIHILAMSRDTIMFKVVPVSDPPVNSQKTVYVRAMTEYWPQEDPAIPCMDAGLPFQKGDILQIVDQNDALWWQARKISDLATCAGLIPSKQLLKRKQREFWWSKPYQPHICLKSTMYKEEFVGYGQKVFIAGFRRSMRLCRRKSYLSRLRASVCCAGGCYSAVGAPYEEVVRYQRRPSDKHRLIVLVGPSGVGVNELRRQLIKFNPSHFQSAVPRTLSFSFIAVHVLKELFSLSHACRMLEHGEYKGHLYGTSVDAVQAVLDEGKICVMDLEPQVGPRFTIECDNKVYIFFCLPHKVCAILIFLSFLSIFLLKDEDLQEMEELAQKIETQFGQFFDHVIVNDSLQDACAQLLSVIQKAQEEPQWVPATWISSGTES